MNINHQAANEQKAQTLLPKGDYEFAVLSAEEKTSQAGKQMIALVLSVFNDETGRKVRVKDWVGEWNWNKVKTLAESLGLGADYEAGQLDARAMVGLSGTAHIRPGKDQKGTQVDSVGWYVPARDEKPAAALVSQGSDDDDSVPFCQGSDDDDSVPF